MKIRYEVTIDDMLAFNRIHVLNAPTYRKSLMLGMILVGLLPLFITVALVVILKLPAVPVLVVGVLLSCLYAWRYRVRFPSAIDRMTRRMLSTGDNQGMFGTHELEIEDEWLVERTDVNASRQAWKGIEKIVENDDYIFLYLSAVTAHVVPKRSVSSGDLAAFMARARQLQSAARQLQLATRVASGS